VWNWARDAAISLLATGSIMSSGVIALDCLIRKQYTSVCVCVQFVKESKLQFVKAF